MVKVRIGDLVLGGQVRNRAIVVQSKTGKPMQFELMQDARASLLAWLERRGGTLADYVFPSRVDHADHLSTRQYARLVCKVLGVSESGYFAWRDRPACRRQREDMVLLAHVRSAFALSNGTYGSPRMAHELRDPGPAGGASPYGQADAGQRL